MTPRPKIFTLGWEFPPLYAGGLGPACYGLIKALSEHADVTLILPQSDENFKMNNVEIIGLNNWVKDDGNRKPRKVEITIEDEGISDNRQSRKIEVANLNVSEDDRQPRKVEINRSKDFFVQSLPSANLKFNAYPLLVPRKAPGRISFLSDANFTQDEIMFSEKEKQTLFSEKDIYGNNIMEKVAAYAEAVKEVAAEKKFDIIHAHDWVTYPAAVQLKLQARKPLVVHVHSLETDRVHSQSRNSVYEIERTGMMHADRVLPVSNFTKSKIVMHYGIEEGKISPVYNGIESEKEKLIRRKGKEKKILFLGRITAQKGPQYYFETARKLLCKMPEAKFYVVGAGDMKEHLEWLVNSNHLQERFVFTGFLPREKVRQLLRTCDAYIMPSVSEPFGLSALEAAQYNIPCVISKQSGAAEVMPNTLHADFWDTEKMANYLYASLKYKYLSQTLTEKTKDDLEDINWNTAAVKVMKAYSHLMN